MRSPGRVFWPLAFVILLTDCTTKRAIEDAVAYEGASKPVVDDLLRFTLAYNEGAAFSISFGPYQRWVLIGLAVVMLAVLARVYGDVTRMGGAGVTGLALIVGGAAGNLLDRLLSARGVVDFIDVGIGTTRFYLFNVADIGIFVGACLLGYAMWRSDIERPADRASLTA